MNDSNVEKRLILQEQSIRISQWRTITVITILVLLKIIDRIFEYSIITVTFFAEKLCK